MKSKPSTKPSLNNLANYGNNRQLDTPTELRISLHKTLDLLTGHILYHEIGAKKSEQIITATLFPDGHLDIVLFIDKIQNQTQ
jgi:hypothetical protein